MALTRKKALRLWERYFGQVMYAEDFHGYLMCRDAYNDEEYFITDHGEKIYCGWNIHHILPVAHGGTSSFQNLICTNIETNNIAGDKITYWIDKRLYQVRRIYGTSDYKIVRLK